MIFDSIKTGLKNILSNKMRSFLSILGIVFGVATLVATMSIGEGTKQQILQSVEALGSNLIIVTSEVTHILERKQTPGLSVRDVELLENHCPLIKSAAPLQLTGGEISYGGKKYFTGIYGISSRFDVIANYYRHRGRFVTEKDVEEKAKVCVLGADVEKQLKTGNLLGRFVRLNNSPFLVVGIMEKKGRTKGKGHERDTSVIIPISVSQEISKDANKISQIYIQGLNSHIIEEAKNEVKRLLIKFHDGHEDFSLWTQEELLEKRRRYMNVFKIALGSIAIVALIVGGIGIMNILLASVSERIKEIGIRKALGANPIDIMLQFLFESLILTVSGAIIGVYVGIAMGNWIAPLLEKYYEQKHYVWESITTLPTVLIAFSFAIIAGFLFGLYPAVKASKLDPCEALTYQ